MYRTVPMEHSYMQVDVWELALLERLPKEICVKDAVRFPIIITLPQTSAILPVTH